MIQQFIYRLFIVIPSGLMALSLNAQTPSNSVSPEIVRLAKEVSEKQNYEGTSAVILLREGRMLVEGDGLHQLSIYIAGKIITKEAKSDYSQIPVFFNSFYEDIDLDFARTIKEDGTVLDVSSDAIQIKTYPDYSGGKTYTDMRVLAFSLPALDVGTLFEYQVTLKQKTPVIETRWLDRFPFNLVLHNLSYPYSTRVDPVYKSRFILTVPREEKFLFELQNAELSPVIRTEGDHKIYLWEANDLPAISLEEGMPYLYDIVPGIILSSLADWNEFAQWAREKFYSRIALTPEIRAKAKELTGDRNPVLEQIEALYNFVQKGIDYLQADLDRGGYTPHYANEILQNRYGDCKDQVILLISLLQAVGIDAFPALIDPYSDREVNSSIPYQYFSHLIVYIPLENDTLWLDTTPENTQFPRLHWGNQNRWVFVIDGKGGKFLKIPSSEPEDNSGAFEISFNMQDDTLRGKMVFLSNGGISDNINYYMNVYRADEQEKILREHIESNFEKVKVASIDIDETIGHRWPFNRTVQFDYLVAMKSLHTFLYSANASFAFPFFTYLSDLPSPDKRQYDYFHSFKFHIAGNEIYSPPGENFVPGIIPENDSLDNPWMSFYRKFTTDNDTVRVRWEFILKQNRIKAQHYSEFYEAFQTTLDKMSWQIEFNKDWESNAWKTEKYEKPTMRISAILTKTETEAQEVLRKLNGQADFAKLAKQYSVGPGKESGGDLGYFTSGDLMPELNAAAEGLAVGRHSDIIKTNIGFFIIKKTDEKSPVELENEKSFTSLLELGKAAYKNHHFEKAVEYLGKAVELEPENQEAHYFLGYAYERSSSPDGSLMLASKRELIEKSSAQFQKVIEISPAYDGEKIIMDPYSKLTGIWGSLAMAYATHGKMDSALWAFKQGQLTGGFYPAILEYNKNIMASCDKNAILLTNGDNDTFPMWFLQMVEGYRKDINVVNLSLLNTSWYVKQLKNDDPFGDNTIPLELTDAEIEQLQPEYLITEREFEIPVYQDTMNIRGKIQWTLKPAIRANILRVQDLALIKLLESNRWERPIYFSTTVSTFNLIGLENYLAMEGLVDRLNSHETDRVSPDELAENCFNRYTYQTISDDHVRYIPDLAKLLQNYHNAFFKLANYYYEHKDLNKTIQTFEMLNKKIPPESLAYKNEEFEFALLYLFGQSYLDNRNYDPAIKLFKKCSELMPDYTNVYYELGTAYRLKGSYDEAISAYKKVIELKPAHFSAHHYLGHVYRSKELYYDAIAAFEKALELEPHHAELYNDLGICCRRLEKYHVAIEYHLKALKLSPENSFTYNQLGFTYMDMKLFDKSIEAYQKSIKFDANDANSYGNMGWVYYLKDDFQNCINYSEKAIALDSTALYAMYNIALSHLRLGEIEKSKRLYIKTRDYNLSLNQEIDPGTIQDLKDLIDKNIMATEARTILSEIFEQYEAEILSPNK